MVYSLRAVGRSVDKLPGPWSLYRRHRPTEVDKDVRSSGTSNVFTIPKQTTMYFVYPPKLCITIVFDFSWDDNGYAKFWGGTRCIMVYMKVVITRDVKRA